VIKTANLLFAPAHSFMVYETMQWSAERSYHGLTFKLLCWYFNFGHRYKKSFI